MARTYDEIKEETASQTKDWSEKQIKEIINIHRNNIVISKALISGLIVNLKIRQNETKNKKKKLQK